MKKSMNLKKSRVGYMGEFEGRKGKGEILMEYSIKNKQQKKDCLFSVFL